MQQASLQITRGSKSELRSVTVVMPTWTKQNDHDNSLSVEIPLFGLKTYTSDETMVDETIGNLVKCFCISAERWGMGLQEELQALGWVVSNNTLDFTIMEYQSSGTVVDFMLQTGVVFSEELELA